jgi:hypothetical protein
MQHALACFALATALFLALGAEARAEPRSGGVNGDLGATPDVDVPRDAHEVPARRRWAARDHQVVTSYHTGALASGIVLFGFNWVLGVVVSRAELSLDDEEADRPAARNHPLMAPLVGPFIALGTDEARPGGEVALLLVNGLAQVGGVALAMVGLSIEERRLVPIALSLRPTGAALAVAF